MGPFWPFLDWNPSNKFFTETMIQVNFRSLCYFNFLQKNQKNPRRFFIKFKKHKFASNLTLSCPEILRTKCFRKKIVLVNYKFDEMLISKNHKISIGGLREKLQKNTKNMILGTYWFFWPKMLKAHFFFWINLV